MAGQAAGGGAKQRALLTLLLLHAGEVIPRDRIVDDLWGDAPPSSAAHAVEVYVSKLRSVLGRDAIRAEAGGYRLDVDLDEIDARRFERLVAEGRQALANSNAVDAAPKLREALELWRGPALADVRYEAFAQAEIARLEELRLAATEELFAAELQVGRHAELIPDIEALTEREPTRERLRAQLMLALYRAGRQADALAAYRDGARLLRDELGLEPGPELRDLEAAILRQDPALAAPQDGPKGNLPAPTTPLIGRADEVAEVIALLRSDARLVTLTGAGGIGKTRLALQAAVELRDELPGGAWFVAFAAIADPALIASEIARAVSAEGDDADAVTAALGTAPTLLVLDNLEHLLDGTDVVSRLLVTCPGLKVLTTSRSPLDLYGEHAWPVPVLPREDAVALFSARAHAARHDFELTAANRPAVETICSRLDGLPLAIELVAARSRELTVDDMLAELPHALELAARGPRDLPDRQRTLRATVEWSYELLEPADAAVFRRLACFAGGWNLDTGREVAGLTRRQNESLIEQSLAIGAGPGRFAMLATIREFAAERLDASGEADDVHRRHAQHFLALASDVDTGLRAGGDQGALLEALEEEHDNLRAAITWAGVHEPELELALVAETATFWIVRGYWDEAARLITAALGRASRDDAVCAKTLTGAGVLARYRGDYDLARRELQRAADIYERLGEWPGAVRALTNLGFTEVTVGDTDRARACYEGALAAAERSGIPRDRNQSLNCLADLALREGDWDRAEELSLEGLTLAREIQDRESIGVCMMNRAQAALALDRADTALELARAALDAWAPLKDPAHLALCFDALAFGLSTRDADAAAVLLGASASMRGEVGAELDDLEQMVRDRAERAVGKALPEGRVDEATTRGREMSLDDAIAEAHAASGRVRTAQES